MITPSKPLSLVLTISLLALTLCVSSAVQKAATETKGRLPNNYGKIGLSDLQKQKIYTIQAKYKTRIEELEKELKELHEKQDKEVSDVLTAAQAKLLHELELPEPAKSKGKE